MIKQDIDLNLALKLSQTPAPQPISESLLGKSGEQELPGPGNRGGKLDDRHSDHPAEDAEHDDERSSNGQATAHDINTELEPIDWEDFDQRYGAKLDQAAAIEEEIHEEFKMLCQVCFLRQPAGYFSDYFLVLYLLGQCSHQLR